LNLASDFVCSRLSVVPELMVGYWGQSESNEQFFFLKRNNFYFQHMHVSMCIDV